MKPTLQAHGAHVLKFGRMVPNLGRIGELTTAILEMLRSQDWRDYADSTGEYHFLPGEFDYFLAEHAVAASDIPRLYLLVDKEHDEKKELLAAMDSSQKDNPKYRRTVTAVMQAHPKSSLASNWTLYGWDKTKHPVGVRATVRIRTGVTYEKRARQHRQRELKDRRGELDRTVETLVQRFDEAALRYIVDGLREHLAKVRKSGNAGRPAKDHDQWARDAKRLKGNAKELAKLWGSSKATTYKRLSLIKTRLNETRKAS